MGAVVIVKVDYCTHAHTQGLDAVVFKCTDTGSDVFLL